MKKLFLTFIVVAATLCGCKTATEIDSSYAQSNFDVTCLGTDLDGSQTLRAFGKGKDKAQAIEQARKNALHAVIFKGITSGTGECNKRPLITEVNAEEKYETYFNKFFKDGGEYQRFTSLEDEKFSKSGGSSSRIKAADSTIENWGITVRVDRAGLKTKLIEDSIIKE